jgi:hypothetical protein
MTAHTDLDADAMSEPFIFIGTHTLREGKLEGFKKACRELVEVVEANEPRLIAFNIYVNEDGTEATVVQVHPDPDSMLFTCRWPASTSARPTSRSWRRRSASTSTESPATPSWR